MVEIRVLRIISFCSVDQINCSLFAFHSETCQWMLTLTTRPKHLLQTLQQYLGFSTTCKRFEPGRNLIKFPVIQLFLSFKSST